MEATATHPKLSDAALEAIAERFKLMGDPTRIKILHELMSGEKNVTDLVARLGTTQGNISKQLGILAGGGLVSRERRGLNVFYAIADPSIVTLCETVCANLETHLERKMTNLRRRD
jgi:ArsR family transcriptional regulator